MNEHEDVINKRKEKIISYINNSKSWVYYVLLAIIVFFSVKIRTLPMKINPQTGKPGLWDITTDTWTLGPDLDPFLFLRWAKHIVEKGSIMAIDSMRYVPLGYDTRGELLGTPYLISWVHKASLALGFSNSIELSAIIYPVIIFALTVIAFYFFVRELFIDDMGFSKASIIALIASFFLTVSPSLLPRTIAGIPEKESGAFFFMFASLYFFLVAWKAKSNVERYSMTILAGLSAAGMGLIWGGSSFLIITIGVSFFISFFLGQVNRERLFIYAIWILFALFLPGFYSTRFSIENVLTSTISGAVISFLIIVVLHKAIMRTSFKEYYHFNGISKIPAPVVTFSATIIFIGLLVVFLGMVGVKGFGIDFISHKYKDIVSNLITPTTSRFGVTVAENRQPYFKEWSSNFGPTIKGGIPLLFWLFFIGSVYLYYSIMSVFNRKERIILTLSYLIFITALIFSRYSAESSLNGINKFSIIVYAIGFLTLIGSLGYYYFISFKNKDEHKLRNIHIGLIMLFSFFFLSIVAARGAVRTIMVLVPTSSVMASYLIVALWNDMFRVKDETLKLFMKIMFGLVLIATIFAGYGLYKESSSMAASYIPTPYTQQWQKAMSWVRENTQETAVFAHWWDYGYWLQSIGNRATVLDGGNAIVYWNYMMGRYALTGSNQKEALEYLYAHNTTHFLIDSSDIGKYPAFSSIGSDVNYDRYSWITNFDRDASQSQETKNTTLYVYKGGTVVDEDIIYNQNGTNILIPAKSSAVAGFILEFDKNGTLISQPKAVYVYQGKQYVLPLRYAYQRSFIDYGSGIEAGIFLMTRVLDTGNGVQIEKDGTLLYLSKRVVNSQLARLYLYRENNPNFIPAHSEDDYIVAALKAQNAIDKDEQFVYFNGFRGPISIWEIKYPEGIEFKPEYIDTNYPIELQISSSW